MERDCVISHGSATFLNERLFKCSDKFKVPVCERCGVITNKRDECTICKTSKVSETNIPYASGLLFKELKAMSIKVSFEVK